MLQEVGELWMSLPAESVPAVEGMIRYVRKVTLDKIATKLGMSHCTAYSIVLEKLHFSKISCCWVP